MKRIVLLFGLFSLFTILTIYAKVTPAAIFVDNMVLQLNKPNVIFGNADTEKYIDVFFNEKKYTSEVKLGKWSIILEAYNVGGSYNVENPRAVRYAWADFPICNLYNSIDLPVTSFRTDNFYPITSN